VLITETALIDYPGMWLKGGEGNNLNSIFPAFPQEVKMKEGSDRSEPVTKYAEYLADTDGSRDFPWRIFAISKNDGDLLENQLSFQLAGKLQIEDASWIKPGKVAWDWWNYTISMVWILEQE